MRVSASTVAERGEQARISTGSAPRGETGPARCTHCGLVVPAERRSSFCCAGCEAVHALLHEEGLTRFYDLGGGQLGAVGAVPRASAHEWLPELEERHALADGTVCLALDVQGIRCAACVWLLQQLWKRVPGGRALQLDASMGRATLLYARGSGAAAAFLQRTARLGYPMAPAGRRVARDTGLLVRLGICTALAMNAMILAVAQYAGVGASDPAIDRVFGWVQALLATGSLVVGGQVFFAGALAGLRARTAHMDLPIALGLALAWGGSMFGQLTGGPVYFDTVALFVAFMLGGRFLQQRSLARGRDLVLACDGVEHLRARRLADGAVSVVQVADVRAGDELLLAPGDLVPVRARLLAAADCSLDWISGESEPRAFAPGETVPAGAFVAGRRPVRVLAEADYLQSGLAALLAQPPTDREDVRGKVRFWERLARGYSLAVLGAALLGALVWLPIDAARSLPVAISLLVITCPCAFGIAAPLAFHLTLARLRRGGVFVRSRSLFDKLGRVRKVVFDKTGTLTHGGLRATAVMAPAAELVPLLATMAASSNHPASQAVLAGLGPAPAFDGAAIVEEQPGGGTVARRGDAEYRLGSARFCGVEPLARGARECVLARDGAVLARFLLDEDFRAGAGDEVRSLQRRGMEVHVLSGDRPEHVAVAAARLGVDPARAHGGMSPEDKAAFVARLDDADTMMVGDGINDAPAFAAAFCAGTPAMDRPVLPARADFFFRGATAGAVEQVVAAAEHYRRVVRANLRLALAYNGSTLALGFLGLLTPLACAVLMPLSSLLLVLHTSARLGRRAAPPAGGAA
ncbi:MAG: heavy metal translocating P-type ATPase metal-binding domain-containing protein [Planctomycetota bacterium]